MRETRPVAWLKAALKDFQKFPSGAQQKISTALTFVADGFTPTDVKPLTGLGAGIWEIVIRGRAGAFRVVYALKLGDAIIVIHAFQKKSKTGIATPKFEIDVIVERIKRLKEAAND